MQVKRYIREGLCGFLRGGACRSTYRISAHVNVKGLGEAEGVEMGPGAKELTKKKRGIIYII